MTYFVHLNGNRNDQNLVRKLLWNVQSLWNRDVTVSHTYIRMENIVRASVNVSRSVNQIY